MARDFNEDQITAIKWNKGPVLVLGTPGSGKTTVIVERIGTLIDEYKVSPSKILVITFTRAAAESMKERFVMLRGDKKCDARFGTFHSFFFWILKTAYGYDNSSILSEENRRKMIREIINSLRSDFEAGEEAFEITTQVDSLGAVRENLEKQGYSFAVAEEQMIPQNTVRITDEENVKKFQKLLDMLEEDDDVQNVFHNWEE